MTDPAASRLHRSPRRRLLSTLGAALLFGAAVTEARARRGRVERRWRRRDERLERFKDEREDFHDSGRRFRERVAAAIRSGELRPVRELNARLRALGFELLDAEVFQTASGWVYDIRVLGPAGRVRDVLIDGRTLRRLGGAPVVRPLD